MDLLPYSRDMFLQDASVFLMSADLECDLDVPAALHEVGIRRFQLLAIPAQSSVIALCSYSCSFRSSLNDCYPLLYLIVLALQLLDVRVVAVLHLPQFITFF